MKYVIALVLGLVSGVALFVLGLYYNPFVGQSTVSPLAVTTRHVVELSFSAVPGDALLYTDSGETIIQPHPDRVAEIWEPATQDSNIFVTTLQTGRGEFAGLGIKMLTRSEETSLLRGRALANSVWHIYLPGKGTLLIEQTENYWTYIRDIVIPARWSSAKSWRGSFHSILTSGPGSLGTAKVTGGSGLFAGLTSEAVESLTASGYSATNGPVAMQGDIAIVLPSPSGAQ